MRRAKIAMVFASVFVLAAFGQRRHTVLIPTAVVEDSLYAALTGINDARRLATVADSAGIPRLAFWALALQEGGPTGRNNILGCSRWSDTTPRRCAQPFAQRDIGRMQINPRGSAITQCNARLVRTNYEENVRCAARHYVMLMERCHGDDACALRLYNGRGPRARAHLVRVQQQIGLLWLRLERADALTLLDS